MAAILELPEFEGPEGHSINEFEIREAINKLKYGKASGVDCISTDLLKVCAGNRHMLVSLAVIFSQCLHESRNPADWQIALCSGRRIEEREAFLARLYSVCPPARQLSDEGRCRWVMGDELPREIENSLYRYLIAISKLRLGILTEQGEGS